MWQNEFLVGMVGLVALNLRDRLHRNGQTSDDELEDEPAGHEELTFTVPESTDPSTRFTALPRKRNQASPAQRKAQMMVWGMLATLPASLLAVAIALAAIAGGGGGGSTTTSATGPGNYKFAGPARIAAIDYLAGNPSKLPAVPGIDFVLARTPTEANTAVKKAPAKPIAYTDLTWERADSILISKTLIELHTFTVVSPSGLQNLTVAIADHDGPVISALPSLSPARAGTAPTQPDLAWSNVYQGTTLTPASQARLQKWFEAYAAGDTNTLYDLTGDPELHTYPGLGGYRVDGAVEISPAVSREKGTFLVTVTANLVASNDPGLKLRPSYDLLLGNTTSAAVTVTSWGPHGSGPILMPFDKGMTPQTP